MRRLSLFLAGVLLTVLAASCGGDTKEVIKEVPAPTVSVQGNVAIEVGKTAAFTATTTDGTDAEYEWTTSDANVATVAADGVVSGVAQGTAIITATGKQTGAAGTWGVHVYTATTEPGKVARVFVSGAALVEVGKTIALEAETVDGEDAGYTWESSAAGIATVDEKGEVTGVAEGSVTITATGTDTGEQGSWNVFVFVTEEPPVPEAEVAVSGPSSVKVGETITLTATTTDGEDSGYDWKSSDEAVATVDAAGVVTGLAVGPAVITATGKDTAASADWNLFVWDGAPPPDPIVTVVGPLSAVEGQTKQFVATTANGNDSAYDWQSDNEAVATVDTDGIVTAVGPGTAIITATGADTAAAGQQGIVVMDYVPEVPFEQLWEGSGHADFAAEAFVHWDGDDPAQVPTSCAKCHSTGGYLDFLGVDGSEVGKVDKAAAIGTVVSCTACHNSATAVLSEVTFPSGAKVTGLGDEARCMLCHQGRESTVSVDKAIADNVSYVDADSKGDGKLAFKNVHYFAAGATLFGGQVKGGYEYTGKYYDKKFPHATGYDRCNACHDPHTLEVQTAQCASCHDGATDLAKVEAIRMTGSGLDYDGDGDVEEGIREELETMTEDLYAAIQKYAKDVAGSPIVYYAGAHPYFFIDTNANGQVDEGEAVSANKYVAWTPRLLRAAYNYQYAHKDPGAFAHNAKYIIQLLYDSMEDLGTKVAIDMTGMHRTGEGHFDSGAEAWRHWDGDGAVPSSCARCHSPTGFELYAKYGVDTLMSQPPSDGMNCMTCHTDVDYANGAPRKYIAQITFPSGKIVKNDANAPDDSLICASCHMGRESKTSIDTMINGGGALSFKNVHYLPAAAVEWGKDAGVLYEYAGKTYAGKLAHFSPDSAKCSYCHDLSGEDHKFKPELVASCKGCHSEAAGDLTKIRKNRTLDYDGDGSNTEKLADEINGLSDALYKQMQAVGTAAGKPLVYDAKTSPYFLNDKNGNGLADADELNSGNKYTGWTAALVKAAHNFQVSHREPGAWAHNTDYMAQVLIDSIEDLGGDISKFKRP